MPVTPSPPWLPPTSATSPQVQARSPWEVTSLPLSSAYLEDVPAPFGALSPVCFHSGGRLHPLPLTGPLVLYSGSLYRLAGEEEVSAFLANPNRYADATTLPADVATEWQGEAGEVWADGLCPVAVSEVISGSRQWVERG